MKSWSSYYYKAIERLTRVTTSGRRIRELDGLRFIAIATVFVQHSFQVVDRHLSTRTPASLDLGAILIRDWRIGVELFFLISGFILASPFAAQHILGAAPVKLKQYYWRRVTRLEPPYLLSLVICYAALVFYWHQSARELLPHLLASSLYLHNIVYNGLSTISPVTWSLEVEVQFYILAPFLALVFLIRKRWLRRTVILGGAVVWLQALKLIPHSATDLPSTLIGYLPFFLMGFVLADVYVVDWKQDQPGSLWCDILALLGWLALPLWFQQIVYFHRNVLGGSSFPFILLALVWLSFRSIYIRKFLASSFFTTVGGMCYSIYLLHLPLLNILGDYSPIPPLTNSLGINTLLYSLLWGAPILAVSILFFVLIEKPCMVKNWPQRVWALWRLKFRRPTDTSTGVLVTGREPAP